MSPRRSKERVRTIFLTVHARTRSVTTSLNLAKTSIKVKTKMAILSATSKTQAASRIKTGRCRRRATSRRSKKNRTSRINRKSTRIKPDLKTPSSSSHNWAGKEVPSRSRSHNKKTQTRKKFSLRAMRHAVSVTQEFALEAMEAPLDRC